MPGEQELAQPRAHTRLADENRRRVVAEPAAHPDDERLCASFELPLSTSSRTRHWRVLREAGLVHQRDAGNGCASASARTTWTSGSPA